MTYQVTRPQDEYQIVIMTAFGSMAIQRRNNAAEWDYVMKPANGQESVGNLGTTDAAKAHEWAIEKARRYGIIQ